ncbi:MAG: uroporphyrinogen decarboxylase [Deltaproteobacteria bacterium]|nr:uroporphyrinogen decarboxylase [Deltaproteobacteria bacterium]
MSENIFKSALNHSNEGRPPVWFMRQAGRYHSHYQRLRAANSFIDLCKKPELACEVTFGPLDDFGFDAGILFSDILFPLEAMGMGLNFEEGPKLDFQLRERADVARLKGGVALAGHLDFQAQALRLIRARLPADKGLIGFVGAPLTLYYYAVEGSHQNLDRSVKRSAHEGLRDGRFDSFCVKLLDLLAQNMALQARAGADCVALFDTCAGELTPAEYRATAVPALQAVLERFAQLCPGVPVVYYSKNTGARHWAELRGLPIACLGIDWNHDLPTVLREWSGEFAIQGNIDPNWLFLEPADLEARLRQVFASVLALPADIRRAWVCGLGHGVLPKTPEHNVRLFLRIQKEMFS